MNDAYWDCGGCFPFFLLVTQDPAYNTAETSAILLQDLALPTASLGSGHRTRTT